MTIKYWDCNNKGIFVEKYIPQPEKIVVCHGLESNDVGSWRIKPHRGQKAALLDFRRH